MDANFQLPAALEDYKSYKLWVVWKKVDQGNGKATKVPYQPDNPSRKAKNNDPATWSDAATAISAAVEHDFDGIGINLKDGEIGGFDIDHCRDAATGVIDLYVQRLVANANTYTEISPSGTGLHVFGLYNGEPKKGRKQSVPGANGVSIESYRRDGRYVTVTSDHLAGTPHELNDITDLIEHTVAELAAANGGPTERNAEQREASRGTTDLPRDAAALLFIADGGAGNSHAGYASRSELMFAFVIKCLRAGVDGNAIANACLDPARNGYAIHDHCVEKGGRGYVERQIEQARDRIVDGIDARVAEINKDHALVLVGDKSVVMKLEGCTEFRLLKVGAFRQWFSNEQVRVGKTIRSIGEIWLNHPQRRQYQDIEFAPVGGRDGHYNLWRGFSVAPRAGSCKKFLDHLHDNVAQGDEYLFDWVVGWFAQIVQQPAEKIGTSLGLRGKQGAGKTIVGQIIGSLFPDHYRLVADPRYVTGRFNAHMVNLLLLQADEAFFAGDKREQGKLKDLVTGSEHPIEFKGIETIWVKNHIRLMATSNEDFVVPAGFDERRFALLDVANTQAQKHEYFAAIINEQNNGGREALLHHFKEFDLKKVNLREIPKTTALLEQKIRTMTPEQAWWFETLKRGVLPWGIDEPNTCSTRKLFSRYVRHADVQGARRKSIETTVGTFLHRSVGADLTVIQKKQCKFRGRLGSELTDTGQAYVFPPLKECRERFATQIGQEVIWGDDADWQHEPKFAAEADEDSPL